MKVYPQTVSTPRGCLVGWKATSNRCPVYYRESGRGRCVPKYVVGKTYTAEDVSFWPEINFKDIQSAKKLAKARAKFIKLGKARAVDGDFLARDVCLPGIHLCKTPKAATEWGTGRASIFGEEKIIPVAYSPKSVVGKKGDDVIVVYRIKVLG